MSTNDVALLDKARLQGSPARLARPLPFGYDNPAMDPSDPAALPWLKVSVALQDTSTFPWAPRGNRQRCRGTSHRSHE